MTAASDARFLAPDPPPWAARGLALLLLVLFPACVGASFVVHVPETVVTRFVLAAANGADPVRTLHDGIVASVHVADAQAVNAGATLFVVVSESGGDRLAERSALATHLSGGPVRLANERQKYESQREADNQERLRLVKRLASVEAQAEARQRQAVLAAEIARREQKSHEAGLTSFVAASRSKLEAERLAIELEQVRAEAAETRVGLARLEFEIAAHRAAYEELTRAVTEDLERSRSRKEILDHERSRDGSSAPAVVAPCTGTIVTLLVRNAGTVVRSQDTLAEIVCRDEPLHAELTLPQRGMALVARGQVVKLRYDAFPYERYGVRYATLRWLAPSSSSSSADGTSFRALADLDEQSVRIGSQVYQLLPGMVGHASIVVGRRSLASYAIDPLRRMREALASERPARGDQ